jgi:ribosome biogenesis GTPase
MARKRKIRIDFRKNRTDRARPGDWTRKFVRNEESEDNDQAAADERIGGRGEISRRRTVIVNQSADGEPDGVAPLLDVDEAACLRGRVLCVFGLASSVQAEDGAIYQCVTRRLLKTVASELRQVVAAGDRVLFRPVPASDAREGVIQRVEPRQGCLCRTAKGRQQLLVANVEQVLIVTSAAEPRLKPNLIDRMLVAAEQAKIRPIVCVNKIDLVDPSLLEPLVGVYSQMGYEVLLLSAVTGFGIPRLLRRLQRRATAVAGQSGVGKSSLLNAVDPKLALAVRTVSGENQKGRHTTTTARLLPLEFGGYVVDTPGIRQFELWDVIAEEIAGLYRDLRSYVSLCRFPDCTHTHEADCAVKNAVADGRLDERRYESYCHLRAGDAE